MQKYLLTPYKACHHCLVHYLQKEISATPQSNPQEINHRSLILDDVA